MGTAGTVAVLGGLIASAGMTASAVYEVHAVRSELAKSRADLVGARQELRSAREVVGLLSNRVENLENEWLTLSVVRDVAERSPIPIASASIASGSTPSVLAPAIVSFNSLPPSAVTLDGQALGQTPRVRIFVPVGRHEARFATDGDARTVRFDAAPGEVKTVTARLSSPLPALPAVAAATDDGF